MTNEERNAMIEECARFLGARADSFISCGNMFGDATPEETEERMGFYEMAHMFSMAAESLREMIPEYRAIQERNMKKIRQWMKSLDSDNPQPLPDVELQPKDN